MILLMLVIHLFYAWVLFTTINVCFWDQKARKAPMTTGDVGFLLISLGAYVGTGIYLFC